MSDLTKTDGWLIRSGDVCYGTPASLLKQHAEHLRYWAGSASRPASQALTQIAAEPDLVGAWAREHQPRVEPVPLIDPLDYVGVRPGGKPGPMSDG